MMPICEKLLEVAVRKQLNEYLETNNLMTRFQFGFRE